MLNQPRTGVYKMPRGGAAWKLLRGSVAMPAGKSEKPWYYPVSFAVDWTKGAPGSRPVMFLADMRNNGQGDGATGVWKTSDGGATWRMVHPSDNPADITIDLNHPNRVYVSGARDASNWGAAKYGQWGYGGALFSDDGGETFKTDDANPFQVRTKTVAVDATDRCKLWHATAGNGLVVGPAPKGLPGCP